MTLFDCSVNGSGTVTQIGGGDATHRRLVDLGLLGARFHVRARNKHSVLVDFGPMSCVIQSSVAANITILER
ncbi:MAG: ferrous iron transport protein A [Clostridiales bacterium]|nr:ferrous iron transport protein A [Clostridiales bacterium]